MQAEQVLGGTRSTRADIEVLADQSVITHYRRLTGRDTASTSSAADGPGGSDSKQRPIEGECAICYDTLKVGHLYLKLIAAHTRCHCRMHFLPCISFCLCYLLMSTALMIDQSFATLYQPNWSCFSGISMLNVDAG